jgi:hypothetical protein
LHPIQCHPRLSGSKRSRTPGDLDSLARSGDVEGTARLGDRVFKRLIPVDKFVENSEIRSRAGPADRARRLGL